MDKDALFRQVLQSGKDAIYRICCCYVRDPEDRKDVLQEALLRVYQHVGSFRGKSALNTWLYRITVNACFDFLRRQKRHERVLDRSSDLDTVANAAHGGRLIEGTSDIEAMYAAITRLPIPDRTLVSLYLEDLSTREIAEVMGISEGNVRVKMTRIREALRRMLEVSRNGSRQLQG